MTLRMYYLQELTQYAFRPEQPSSKYFAKEGNLRLEILDRLSKAVGRLLVKKYIANILTLTARKKEIEN